MTHELDNLNHIRLINRIIMEVAVSSPYEVHKLLGVMQRPKSKYLLVEVGKDSNKMVFVEDMADVEHCGGRCCNILSNGKRPSGFGFNFVDDSISESFFISADNLVIPDYEKPTFNDILKLPKIKDGSFWKMFETLEGELRIERDYSKDPDKDNNIKVEVLFEQSDDCRRYAQLSRILFKGAPVIIAKFAGREGDDDKNYEVINKNGFLSLLAYLRQNYALPDECEPTPLDGTAFNYLNFYGKTVQWKLNEMATN